MNWNCPSYHQQYTEGCHLCYLYKTHEGYREAFDRLAQIRSDDGKPPRWWRRYWIFAKAVWRHVRHGLPTATPEDRAARQAICDTCEWQDKVKKICKQCGCGQREGALLDKLRWAREQCPLLGNRPGPWWAPVKGETIWRRAWRLLRGR